MRGQLLRWLLIPLLLLLALNAFLSDRAAIATANQAYDRLLLASVHAIANEVAVVDGEIAVDLPYVALELFESNIQQRIFYRVDGPSGATITGYDDLPLPSKQPPSSEPVLYRALYRGEIVYLAALYKPIYDYRLKGPVVVAVAETAESRQALSREILYDSLILQGLLILAAAMLVWLGLLLGLRPLLRLRDSIARRSPSDLTPIDDGHVQSEMRPMIHAINHHTSRIHKLIVGSERFVADASHQVKAPLTLMRAQVEHGLRERQPSVTQEVLADVLGTIDQMTHLISQLLALASADPEILVDQKLSRLDLCALARSAALELVPAARDKQIDLTFEGAEAGAAVLGSKLLLHELTTNLIDNAIRYTQSHAKISVRVVRDGNQARLEVEDDGPGIPDEERERVFERFYRGKESGELGSGLGLAIAHDICVSHRATIRLTTPPTGRGLRVTVLFPGV